MHSAVSDGTDSPTELVAKAVECGLDVIALCDHDTFDGLVEAQSAGREMGLDVLDGCEISCLLYGASIHLLAYGCDQNNPELVNELTRIRAGRNGRIDAMVEKLNRAGLEISVADVLSMARTAPSIGRPHVADALIAKGYAKDRAQVFAEWLNEDRPAYVPRYSPDLIAMIGLVRSSGGVAVVAHPWARGRKSVMTAKLITMLAEEHGLDGIEVDHQDHDRHDRERLRVLAENLGLLDTGGSDYHGRGKKDHDLGVNLTRQPVYEEILARISAR